MIIPELPSYLTSLGGADYKGLIISLFTLTAMLSRPFSGKLADNIGRVPVIIFGSAICLVCSLFYPILSSVGAFFLLRFIHGFSTGFTPTGQTAYLSDIIPAERRGEAMGLLGTASTLGMASGPALGGTLANQFGLNVMFYCSSALGLFSILIILGIKETLKDKHTFHPRLLKIDTSDLFEPRVLAPCVVMLMSAYAFGAVLTVIPDFGEHAGIKNKGLLFTYFTIASLTVRLIGGKASDRWGRKPVLYVSVTTVALAMAIIALAESKLQLIVGVTLYGFAQGTTSPTLLAWATDLSDPLRKGRGLASLYIFMEMGIGLGALISGFLYDNKSSHFFITFMVSSILAILGIVYMALNRTILKTVV
jgi:MFS family permease